MKNNEYNLPYYVARETQTELETKINMLMSIGWY